MDGPFGPKLPGGWRRLAPNSRRAVQAPDLGPAEVKRAVMESAEGQTASWGRGGGQRFCPAWDPSAWATRARCKRCVRPRQAETRSEEALTRRVKTCGIRGRASEGGDVWACYFMVARPTRRVCVVYTFVCVCTQCVRVRNSRWAPPGDFPSSSCVPSPAADPDPRARARVTTPPGRVQAQGCIDRNAEEQGTGTRGLVAVERTRGLSDGQTVGGQAVRSGAATPPSLPPSLPCLPPSLPPSPPLRFRFRASVWRGCARGR